MESFPSGDMEVTTILVVSDMTNSMDFYSKVLGAKLYREYGGTSAVYQFLNHWILLVTEGGPTEDKPETSFKPPSDPDSVSHSFTIRVKNCDDCYQILKERGAKFITPPYNWGSEIRCFFRDPDGHLFEISQVENL